VIPHDYEELKSHLEELSEECERLKRMPAKVVNKVERIEVIPHDYDDLKHDNE
jgi:hypothetical protein